MDSPDSSDPPARRTEASPPARAVERRLSVHDVDDILRRASRADEAAGLARESATTVTGLMEAAREVGLDPDAVRRAAAIRPSPRGGILTPLTGAPDRYTLRVELPGPLPDDRTRLAAASAAVSRSGEIVVDQPGRFVWRESHGLGRTTVSWDENDAAALTVTADRAGHYLAHWFAGLLGWAATSSLLSISVGPVAATLLFLLTPFVLARPFWIRSARNARRELDDVAMAVLEAVERA